MEREHFPPTIARGYRVEGHQTIVPAVLLANGAVDHHCREESFPFDRYGCNPPTLILPREPCWYSEPRTPRADLAVNVKMGPDAVERLILLGRVIDLKHGEIGVIRLWDHGDPKPLVVP